MHRREPRQAARFAKALGLRLTRLQTLRERITLPRILHQVDHPLFAIAIIGADFQHGTHAKPPLFLVFEHSNGGPKALGLARKG